MKSQDETTRISTERLPSGLAVLSDLEPTALYTVSEVAPLLRVRKRTIRKYCAERVFSKAVKLAGARWLIPGSDILQIFSDVPSAGG